MSDPTTPERPEWSEELFFAFAEEVQEQHAAVHKRIDGLEEMLAQLMLGITDLWAGVETALNQVMGDTPEERAAFKESTLKRRGEMLQSINDLVKES